MTFMNNRTKAAYFSNLSRGLLYSTTLIRLDSPKIDLSIFLGIYLPSSITFGAGLAYSFLLNDPNLSWLNFFWFSSFNVSWYNLSLLFHSTSSLIHYPSIFSNLSLVSITSWLISFSIWFNMYYPSSLSCEASEKDKPIESKKIKKQLLRPYWVLPQWN